MALISRIAIAALLMAVVLYVAVLAVLYANQRRFIYPGWSRGTVAASVDLSGYRTITIDSDGLRERLLYHAPRAGRPVSLFFHGNGDDVRGSAMIVERFVAAGYGAVLPEFRGYNGAPGTPTEQGLYRDARATMAWMAANGIGADRTVMMGYSLGSGVAVQLATEVTPRALVLISPYASIVHVVTSLMPWVPGFLVSERFDSAAKIGRLGCPILMLHGDADTTIPVENSAILKAVQPSAARIVRRGDGHGMIFTEPVQAQILSWLEDKGL